MPLMNNISCDFRVPLVNTSVSPTRILEKATKNNKVVWKYLHDNVIIQEYTKLPEVDKVLTQITGKDQSFSAHIDDVENIKNTFSEIITEMGGNIVGVPFSKYPEIISDTFAPVAGDGTNVITVTEDTGWVNVSLADVGINTKMLMTYGNGRFVGLAVNGSASAYSIDGENWTVTKNIVTGATISCLTYGDGKYVAMTRTDGGTLPIYSVDGITWDTGDDYLSDPTPTSIVYGHAGFIALGDKMLFSDDGIHWTDGEQPASPNGTLFRSISYAGGTYIYVPINTTNMNICYGAKTCSRYSNYLPSRGTYASVVYGNGKFVSKSSSDSIAIYSVGGKTWTVSDLGTYGNWLPLIFGDGKFVTVSSDKNIFGYSEDGMSWIKETLPVTDTWASVTYGNGKFIILNENSTVCLCRSFAHISRYNDKPIQYNELVENVSFRDEACVRQINVNNVDDIDIAFIASETSNRIDIIATISDENIRNVVLKVDKTGSNVEFNLICDTSIKLSEGNNTFSIPIEKVHTNVVVDVCALHYNTTVEIILAVNRYGGEW